MRRPLGFTLLEVLIVVALTVIIGLGGFLSLSGFRQEQDLNLTAKSMVGFLRDVQSKAANQESATEWGVRFDNPASGRDAYMLFSGPAFIAASTTVSLPASVEFSDPASGSSKDTVFAKITGLPDSAASVTIRLISNTSSTKTITINAQGAIQEQ